MVSAEKNNWGMYMRRTSFRALYCCAAATLTSLSVAQAQTSATDSDARLEEIVITATRTETNLQQTPIAVTAISAEALQDRNVATILDIGNYVPSLSIGSRSGTSTANGGVSIRGMGVDSFGSSAAVGIYVDDVYFASGPGNLLGLLDVDRVEVLRGPQGTLFGRNTIAGAIQYVTRAPNREFGGYITATGGNFDRRDFQGVINIPLGDTFAVRLVGSSTDRGGYIHDLFTGAERGADRTQTARLKARWTPSDRLTVDLKGEYVNERTNGRAVLIDEVNPNAQFVGLAGFLGETRPLDNSYLSPNDHSFAGFNAPDYLHFHTSVGEAVINYRLSDDFNIKSITAYSKYGNRLAQDFDATPLSILSGVPSHDDTNVLSQELQLGGKSLSNRLKWTAGAFYYDSKERQDPGQQIVLGLAPPNPVRQTSAPKRFTARLRSISQTACR
jgi:iron complex outermembrane receptor protein